MFQNHLKELKKKRRLMSGNSEKRAIRAYNRIFPAHMVEVPMDSTEKQIPGAPVKGFRSRTHFAMIFRTDRPGEYRLSIGRTEPEDKGVKMADGIAWDEIQRIKRECGFGEWEGVEVYPPDSKLVNIANLRHIVLKKDGWGFSWDTEAPLNV